MSLTDNSEKQTSDFVHYVHANLKWHCILQWHGLNYRDDADIQPIKNYPMKHM